MTASQSPTVFYKGDSYSTIKRYIADQSIDCIYFNPPFGTTKNNWDEKLNWKQLFEEFYRVLQPDGVIIIHCSVPFNYTLIREAPKPPTYSWYWKKEGVTCPFIAKVQPMRNTEEVLVWTNKHVRYYPQRVGDEERTITANGGRSDLPTSYYGKLYEREPKIVKGYLQTHHIDMKRSVDGFSTRPTEMVELMIKSYTKEGDTILDPTCYKGMCGVIAKRMGRKWIGIDKHFLPERLLSG
jgi:site-specific DNA-methyltransferase (adenine-specific)